MKKLKLIEEEKDKKRRKNENKKNFLNVKKKKLKKHWITLTSKHVIIITMNKYKLFHPHSSSYPVVIAQIFLLIFYMTSYVFSHLLFIINCQTNRFFEPAIIGMECPATLTLSSSFSLHNHTQWIPAPVSQKQMSTFSVLFVLCLLSCNL